MFISFMSSEYYFYADACTFKCSCENNDGQILITPIIISVLKVLCYSKINTWLLSFSYLNTHVHVCKIVVEGTHLR